MQVKKNFLFTSKTKQKTVKHFSWFQLNRILNCFSARTCTRFLWELRGFTDEAMSGDGISSGPNQGKQRQALTIQPHGPYCVYYCIFIWAVYCDFCLWFQRVILVTLWSNFLLLSVSFKIFLDLQTIHTIGVPQCHVLCYSNHLTCDKSAECIMC